MNMEDIAEELTRGEIDFVRQDGCLVHSLGWVDVVLREDCAYRICYRRSKMEHCSAIFRKDAFLWPSAIALQFLMHIKNPLRVLLETQNSYVEHGVILALRTLSRTEFLDVVSQILFTARRLEEGINRIYVSRDQEQQLIRIAKSLKITQREMKDLFRRVAGSARAALEIMR